MRPRPWSRRSCPRSSAVTSGTHDAWRWSSATSNTVSCRRFRRSRADPGGQTEVCVLSGRTVRTVSTRAQWFARRSLTAAHRLSTRVSVMVRVFPGLTALVLILLAVLVEALMLGWPTVMPWSSFLPVIVLAGMFLPPRWLAACLLYTSVLLAYDGWSLKGDRGDYFAAMVVIAVMAALMTWLAVSRAPLGVQGTLAESMLVDLRDRI